MTNSSGRSAGTGSIGSSGNSGRSGSTGSTGSTAADTATDAAQGAPEPPHQRLERNWTELLQELRVIQTGTQILTGFLLTLPFQARFSSLTAFQLTLYLALVIGAALATALALTPVAVHRLLFRDGAKEQIVDTGNSIAIATLGVVSLVLAGTVTFVFDVVLGDTSALIVGVTALVVLLGLWAVLPLAVRPRSGTSTGRPAETRPADTRPAETEPAETDRPGPAAP